MSRLVYLNGQLVPPEKAVVNVFDHGLLYGDGVFEGIRIYGGKIFRLEAHLRRLYESAAAIRLIMPLTPEEMSSAVLETVAANSDLRDGYIRLVVTRGVGDLGLSPQKCRRPSVIIIVDQIALYAPEKYEQGLAVVIACTPRNHPDAVNPRIKSLNYLNNILAGIEALDAGADEAILLNFSGCVAEASGDNVFVVRNGVVQTPPPEAGLLLGVMRGEVLAIFAATGRQVEEVNLRPADLYAADECFLTGTAAEVIAVTRIDGRTIGAGRAGPVTRAIGEEYRRRINV